MIPYRMHLLTGDIRVWLTRYRPAGGLLESEYSDAFIVVCSPCGTSVTIPRSALTTTGALPAFHCRCDAAATNERAWREHFGILAEAFA